MPIRPPALDDRTFDDLVDELLTRIPAHTPEWTNPRIGDPGRTLVELFAWLGTTLLYRANLVPERQRLVFLRLLGQPLLPARPASGLVTVSIDDDTLSSAAYLQPAATVSGPLDFETTAELTVLPVTAEMFFKRALTDDERTADMAAIVRGLQQVYGLSAAATPYVTTPVFAAGVPEVGGFDLVGQTVDKCLWLALLAPRPELVAGVRKTLGADSTGARQVLSVGVAPSIAVPALFEDIGVRGRVPAIWEITAGVNADGLVDYRALDLLDNADTTAGLTRQGVVRLLLPASDAISAPTNDIRTSLSAGVGDRPPRLDDPKKAARLVAWVRLRPTQVVSRLSLSWVGINAVEIDQRATLTGRILGTSDGAPDQEFQLPAPSVEPTSLLVQVEEPNAGYRTWQAIDDLAVAGRDDAVFSLDSEAGTIRFGDAVRGRIPDQGQRVRVAHMRAGGGSGGNLPAAQLTSIRARDLSGEVVSTRLKIQQNLPTLGGEAAETLQHAEQRIPGVLRNHDRVVTAEDYHHIAANTPGVQLGRVEVLPRFKPQQRRADVPGVVSVLVLPAQAGSAPPNPRADRPLLEAVFAYLDARRPLATELYVIGCEYIPLGVGVGVTIRDGFGREAVLGAVRDALRLFLWPLQPGGTTGAGWSLGRSVRERELEVAVARVAGVSSVLGLQLFSRAGNDWTPAAAELTLESWQLPELLSVVVVADAPPPTNLRGVPNPFADQSGVAVPVVPKVC